MPNNQLSELIRERAGLKELTFGCEVKVKGRKEISKVVGVHGENQYTLLWSEKYTVSTTRRHIGELEIIGHPIHPHHWLPLLDVEHTHESWAIQPDGQIMKQYQTKQGINWWVCEMIDNNPENVYWYPEYDFSKDFDSQSEEFYQWLWQQLSNS